MNPILTDERYYHGLLRLERGEFGMKPLRFTDRQLALYAAAGEARETRALCTAGVTLEMMTDAPWLELRFYVTRLSRGRANVTAVAGGMRCPVVELPIEQPGECAARIDLSGEGMREVRVCLPCLVGAELTDLTLGEGTTAAEPIPRRGQLYLAFGDSITQGMEAVDPSRIYPTQVSLNLGMEQLNLGVGGAYFQPELLEDVGLSPSLVSVAYGANDRNLVDTEAAFRENVEGFLSGVERLYPAARKLLIVPLWCAMEGQKGKFADMAGIRTIIREIAKRHPAFQVIEGMAFVPGNESYLADGLHPNDLGFQLFSSSLIRRI